MINIGFINLVKQNMQTHYKSISMTNPVSEWLPVFLGFIGGGISVLSGPPHIMMSSLAGSGLVAIFIAGCSVVGKKLGGIVWIIVEKKYKDYKSKSNKP